ncbi:MAG: NADH-quinone oxidoreductase subunit C [Syntrophales bacterium]|nr:NADH-quinone oxidoreductase subunit C [Syntrophales bacterium]
MDFVQELREALGERFGDRLRIEAVDFGKRGCHLDIAASGDDIETAAFVMDDLGFTLEAISGVDWPAEEAMEVVYDFNKMAAGGRIAIRVRVSRGNPEIPSISKIFGGANWYEREAHDMFGIVFSGHPNLTPLILPEDADFHPLRKDFPP